MVAAMVEEVCSTKSICRMLAMVVWRLNATTELQAFAPTHGAVYLI
jgi:hypothetical protein